MDGARFALIVANDEYDDPGLRRLEAPEHDAAALADVLRDPGVGAFDVQVLHNKTAQEIRTAIEDFFVDRKRDDLLLLHFSCHGVKNADGELFLALKDTRPNRLASTGLPADFVNRLMANSRSQRIALFLDCCYGGAFPRGMLVRAAGEAQIKDTFVAQEEVGGGRGRVVVTASNAMQYSFEAGELSEESVRPSVFTGALVDALSTGEADKDADGWIGMNELFSYVADKVRQISPNQTPQMWAFGAQGDIVVARSRIRRVKPTPLEPELADAMANPLPAARYGLVDLFRERLSSSDLGVALAAHQALTSMLGDDSRRLADTATAALADSDLKVDPPDLDLVLGDDGTASAVLTLSGPPIATAVTAQVDATWLTIEYDDPRLRVHASGPSQPGTEFATLTLKSPI
ncbi:MAG TPA: caspase family protein, partial [Nocardioidaceae bacterium]|nr:caspase family protein [Nocardioidaceae bacterium]